MVVGQNHIILLLNESILTSLFCLLARGKGMRSEDGSKDIIKEFASLPHTQGFPFGLDSVYYRHSGAG
jgi:hypothetical protein